jgi:hypothetical protein
MLAGMASPLPALEKLGPPARLAGQPGLVVDFLFSPAGNGQTRVEAVLGGTSARKKGILGLVCQFEPAEAQGLTATAGLQGTVDLSSLVADSSKQKEFQVVAAADLAPGTWRLLVQAGWQGRPASSIPVRSLRFTVPDLAGTDPRIGDLRFCLSLGPGKPGQMEPDWSLNPWRQVGRRARKPLLVAYPLENIPRDWAGRPLVHRVVFKRLGPGKDHQKEWAHDETRPAGRGHSWEIFAMPPSVLQSFVRGRYLLLVEAWPQGRPEKRIHSYKSVEVLN